MKVADHLLFVEEEVVGGPPARTMTIERVCFGEPLNRMAGSVAELVMPVVAGSTPGHGLRRQTTHDPKRLGVEEEVVGGPPARTMTVINSRTKTMINSRTTTMINSRTMTIAERGPSRAMCE